MISLVKLLAVKEVGEVLEKADLVAMDLVAAVPAVVAL